MKIGPSGRQLGTASSVSSTEAQSSGLSISARTGYLILASLVAPILLLISAWRTNSERYRHWLLTAFVTMYGATIAIRYDPSGEGGDGVRHLLLVYEHYVGMSFFTFLSDLWAVLSLQVASDPAIRDVYKHLVSYFVGAVLGQPQLFFTVIAFVYGYFFIGSLLEISRHLQWQKLNYIILGFAVLLFILKNIEGINTIRTWTGLWILVYACLKYYDSKKRRYLFLMFAPPLVHFGYFVMILPALTVLIFGTHARLYAILFLASSMTTFFNPGDIAELVATTERGEVAVSGYLVEEQESFEETRQRVMAMETRWWHQFSKLGIQKWALNVLIYTLLAGGIYFVFMNYRQKTLFSIGLLTLTMSNSMWFFTALSNRTWLIGCLFILASFLMMRTNPTTAPKLVYRVPRFYKFGVQLSLFLFIPFFVFNLSILLDYPSFFMFVAPFLVWIDPDINMSIKYVLQVLMGLR